MSLMSLSSEAIWVLAIEVFLAARVTLNKYQCVRLDRRKENCVLIFCELEQIKPDS